MLRTNSKAAIENIKAYIMENADGTNYDVDLSGRSFDGVAHFILDTFKSEYKYNLIKVRASEQELFIEWCAGLPSVIDTCYYYNRSAVDDLGEILEETEEEKAKYTEIKAERMLSYLIYREVKKGYEREMKR